jgi:excisionase family DNA binding protein
MRVHEAARALGISGDTLRRLDRAGTIRIPRDHRGHRRLTDDDLNAIRRVIYPEVSRQSEPRVTTRQ